MNIVHYEEKLSHSKTPKQAERILQEYLSHFGFTHYAVTFYAGHTKSGQKIQYDWVSEPLQLWHNYYLDQSYADVDRTLEANHTMTLPLFWDVNEQLGQAKNNREKLIRLESIKFGIDKGLSVPVHGPHNDFLCLTLHQCKNQKTLVDYKTFQFEWLSAAQIFYHYLSKLLVLQGTQHQVTALTKREKQCLELTAKSWRVDQIARELNITPRTVNFHIQNANKKMGTNNKYQTIALLRKGI